MKILVDEMPASKSSCPYAIWKPYPPCMEEPGYWMCGTIKGKLCDCTDKECRLFKTYKSFQENEGK